MNANVERRLSELERKLANVVREGAIVELDTDNALVRVQSGTEDENLTTDWLPWLTTRASHDTTWWCPEVGEQVLLLSPNGDLAQAMVLPALYQEQFETFGNDENISGNYYKDGASITYDREAHSYSISLPADATTSITSKGGVSIEGNTSIDGNVEITGKVTAQGDVIGQGTSLHNHIHGGVIAGEDNTSGPN